MTIWALHGFLGLPSDFDAIKAQCLQARPDLKWNSVDYIHVRELAPSNTLHEWGKNFNRWVHQQDPTETEHILIGYSQGGRLGLEALKDKSSFWKRAVLISANPGLKSSGEKAMRLKSDQEWANQFQQVNFEKTLQKWNAQAVFAGSQTEPRRLEIDYNRRQLAEALTQWSVANQDDHRVTLMKSQIPILYVVGESDVKYGRIGEELHKLNSRIQLKVIQAAGHRVLFDQPQTLAQSILSFLGN